MLIDYETMELTVSYELHKPSYLLRCIHCTILAQRLQHIPPERP